MPASFSISASKRDVKGKGASRRLRRLESSVPAVIYGGGKPAESITLSHKELSRSLENEAFYSHILSLEVDGTTQSVILKDLQRHPYKPIIMHADFLRVQKGQKLHVHVPLHFLNEDKCVGVRLEGGVISHQLVEVEVICLPKDLPEYIEIDMSEVGIESIIHLSDLKLPKGVELAELAKGESHDLPVAAIHKPKGVKADDEEDAAENGES